MPDDVEVADPPDLDASPEEPEVPDDPGGWPAWEEERPTYLRPRFVFLVAAITAVLGFLVYQWGNSGNLTEVGALSTPEATVAAAVVEPGPAGAETCAAPASGNNLEAAEVVRLFLAATTGDRFKGLQVDPEVDAQLAAPGGPAPLQRATRIRGFAVEGEEVTTCVRGWWFDGQGLRSSIDLVAVRPSDKGWVVSRWVRGQAEASQPNDLVSVAFHNGDRACGDPDRMASVLVPRGEPDERLVAALEELLSGPAGRADGAVALVPADVQVVSARVEGLRATVELTRTAEKVNRCQGTAALAQVERTAEALVAASVPAPTTTVPVGRSRPRPTAPPPVEVEVLVDGQPVDALRP